jgi:RNA polymerase primary sigma factor
VITKFDLHYLSPFTFELEQLVLPPESAEFDPSEQTGDATEVSQSDLGFFMGLAGQFDLLSAEQERILGFSIWTSKRRLLRLLRGVGSLEPIEPHRRPITASTRRRLERVEKLARNRAKGRPELIETLATMDDARRRLVQHNMRLVIWVAKKFRGRGFDFIDLIQEGNLGLMRAADRFDPLVGARFSTFATHWIQQGIRRSLAERSRTIRIPVNRIPEVRATIALRGELSKRLGRTAQPEDIAAEMKVSVEKIKELLPAMAPLERIDAPVASTDRTLGDTLADRETPTPLAQAMDSERRRIVSAVLDELPKRQRVILAMRHGIGYPKECTLEEIGEALGLSRERIRQVEKVAVNAVRDWMREHHEDLAQPV